MLESIRNTGGFLSRTVGFALPIRLILGAILGALGGSTFLGLISEFAGYSYAIHYGIRPPLEGIPYLRASVTLLTISLSFLACLTGFPVLKQTEQRFSKLENGLLNDGFFIFSHSACQ